MRSIIVNIYNGMISTNKFFLLLLSLFFISLNFGDYYKILGIPLHNLLFLPLIIVSLYMSYYDYKKTEMGIFRKKMYLVSLFFMWFFSDLVHYLVAKEYELYILGLRTDIVNFLICIVIISFVKNDSRINKVLFSCLFGFFTCMSIAFYEIITENHFIYENISFFDQASTRGYLGNPNDFAVWITTAYFISCMYFLKNHMKKSAVLFFFITLFIVDTTNSRAGFYSLVLFCILFIIKYIFMNKRKYSSVYFAISNTVFFGLALFSALLIYEVIDPLLFMSISGQGNFESDLYRLWILRENINLMFKTLLFGVGPYQSIMYTGINPHNMLIEVVSEHGLLIFLLFIYIIFLVYKRSFDSKLSNIYQSFYFSIVPSFLLLSISSSSSLRLRITWVFLILIFLNSFINDFEEA